MARRAIAGFLVVIVCLLVPFAVAGLWGRDVLLETDGWVALVEPLPRDPDARAAVATELSDVVLDTLGVQGKVRRAAQPLIREGAERAVASDRFANVWVAANRAVHGRLVQALTSDEPPADVELDLRAGVAVALAEAESALAGVVELPGDVPDLPAAPTLADAEAAIEAALGRSLPEDRARVVVLPADRLETARAVYKGVDRGAFGLAILTLALALLTVVIAKDRLRTAATLGLGSALTLLIAWVAAQGIGSVAGSFLGEGVGRAVAEAAARLAADDVGGRFVRTAVVLGTLGLVCGLAGAVRSRRTA